MTVRQNKGPKTIYAIMCNKTDRVYIGCCADVDQRIRQHMSELRKGRKTYTIRPGKRGNSAWQEDYNAHGEDSFKAFVIERNVPIEYAPAVEESYILRYRANEPEYGYNIRPSRITNVIETVEGLPPLAPRA